MDKRISDGPKYLTGHGAGEVRDSLRQLAASLLRTMRSGGNALEVAQQAQALLAAIQRHQSATGALPSAVDLETALRIDEEALPSGRLSADIRRERSARDMIVHGALQYAASKLLRQRTQEWDGEAEMERGIRQFHKLKDGARQSRRKAKRTNRS